MKYLLRDSRPNRADPGIGKTSIADVRFRRVLGEAQWAALPAAVQKRFSKRLVKGDSQLYRGEVTQQNLSRSGWLLAQILRCVGAPLPITKAAIGLPAIVTVTEDAATHSQIWIRQYSRAKGFPQIVHSAKCFTGPTGLEEYIGFGIGMTLTLDVKDGALLFVSDRYFIGKVWRAYLPRFLTPGKLIVGHKDLGRGQFEFSLTLTHKWLGRLLYQRIKFEDMKGEKP